MVAVVVVVVGNEDEQETSQKTSVTTAQRLPLPAVAIAKALVVAATSAGAQRAAGTKFFTVLQRFPPSNGFCNPTNARSEICWYV